jgi:long-chain acyl-CoA synthetase
LLQSLFIGQIFVYGDSFQSALVAVVVPDEEVALKWAADSGDPSLAGLDFKSLCGNNSLHSTIMKEIKRLAKKNGLHGFETPKGVYLESEQFTAENGLTTPTFKLKRQQLRDYYQQQIDEMYAKMPPPPSKL